MKEGKKDLVSMFPDIAKEWDYKKNYPVTPDKVNYGAVKKYFWICPICGNSYPASVNQRTNTNSGSVTDPVNYWREKARTDCSPDLVFGGPPCQAFSQAGKQKALSDPRGILIFDYLRFVEALHPKFFVMENVSNIKSVGKGTLYTEIITKMEAMGYNVSSAVLCAADYGAPQKRHRAIFIGTDKALGKIDLPFPTHSDEINLFQLKPYVTVGEAFEGLPYIGTCNQE